MMMINKWFITKSSDDKSDLFKRQASVPYCKIGIHSHHIISSVTSFKAILPILPNMALAAR